MKELVVNADDFGFTRDVNQGIVDAHTRGILTAATLMANGGAFEDAVRLSRETPSLDVGCHLVLTGGESVSRPGNRLPRDLRAFTADVCFRRIAIEDELRAQIERILAAGVRPTHLDTHKHTHLLPPVLSAVARLGREYGILWIRRPFDFPLAGAGMPFWKQRLSDSLGAARARFHRVIADHGCRTTDHFAGFQLTGHLRTRELASLLELLPEGATEFMCHPGRCGPELRAARTRLKESREAELAALTSREAMEVVSRLGIRLRKYEELGDA